LTWSDFQINEEIEVGQRSQQWQKTLQRGHAFPRYIVKQGVNGESKSRISGRIGYLNVPKTTDPAAHHNHCNCRIAKAAMD